MSITTVEREVIVTKEHPKLTIEQDSVAIAERVLKDGACVFKFREDGRYDVRPAGTGYGLKRGWIILDSWTASAIMAVYNGLNETNQAKLRGLTPERAATVAFKLIG